MFVYRQFVTPSKIKAMSALTSSIYALVRAAILERRIVSAVYDNLPREMCPHVIGWKNGKEHCLFFQFAGGSRRGLPLQGAWRCLDLEMLSEVAISAGRWRTGSGYYENPQVCVDEVDVQI
jgi:hypothetical protein